MGRVVKRVALDFSWPIGTVWEGYLNPFNESKPCPYCKNGFSPQAAYYSDLWYGYLDFKPEDNGSVPFKFDDAVVWDLAKHNVKNAPEYYGTTEHAIAKEAKRLAELFNSRLMHHLNEDDVIALINTGRLMHFTHTFVRDEGWKPVPYVIPTPKEVNDWSINGFGHDSINSYIVVKARCEKEQVSHICPHCDGVRFYWESNEAKIRYDNWQPSEPPTGPGYQMWETVSEGSPISPVFADPVDLAEWLVENRTGFDSSVSAEEWLEMIVGAGSAPSMVAVNGSVTNGVGYIANN